MRQRHAQLGCVLVTVSLLLAGTDVSAQIVGAVRGGTSANPAPVVVPNGLFDGVLSYVDRTHVYVQVPPELQNIDFVQVSNSDKNVADYSLEVEVDEPGTLYVLLDWRIGDNSNATPPDLTATMLWVMDMGFVDTGLTVAIDEGNDGSINQYFAVYGLEVDAGPILLGAQNDTTTGGPGNRNMYGVAFAVEGVSLVCPVGLTATVELQDILLSWRNGDETPASVDILRDGEVIETGAPADPPQYRDIAAPPGPHAYELRFDVLGSECALAVEVTNCPLLIGVDLVTEGVLVTWTNVGEPAEILVLRDGEEIAAVQGFIATYTDVDWSEGVHTYSVVPSEGTCPALERTIEIESPEAIVWVERGGASANPPPAVTSVRLRDGAVAYVDRTHVYVEVPEELVGAEYVRVANSDKEVADYSLDVEFDLPGTIYLLLDWRLGNDSNTTPPDLTATMFWVTDSGFVDTGLTVAIDELNNGSIENRFSVYELELEEPGTFTFAEQNNGGGRNMYAFAFKPSGVVPREICDNGKDDDGDGLIDCEDPDCADAPVCQRPRFRRGDADATDGQVNITDAIFILNYLFQGGTTPPCLDAADADNEFAINITDGIYILSFLFLGGPEPVDPGPFTCGPEPEVDPDADGLGCESYPPEC